MLKVFLHGGRNPRQPQHVDPHPDPGGAHAVCSRSQTIRQGRSSPPPTKWPVEFVLIVNDKGRETFVCHDRIQQILSPAIQATCPLTAAQILFFPTPFFGGRFGCSLAPLPRRSLPTSPAIPAKTSPLGPATPPSGTPPGDLKLEIPAQRLDTHSYAPYPILLREPVVIGTLPGDMAPSALRCAFSARSCSQSNGLSRNLSATILDVLSATSRSRMLCVPCLTTFLS
jgi:hypothetical protein